MKTEEAFALFAAGNSKEWVRREQEEMRPFLEEWDKRIEGYRREAREARDQYNNRPANRSA